MNQEEDKSQFGHGTITVEYIVYICRLVRHGLRLASKSLNRLALCSHASPYLPSRRALACLPDRSYKKPRILPAEGARWPPPRPSIRSQESVVNRSPLSGALCFSEAL